MHRLPDRIDRNHCVVKKQYAIYTPPIDAMIDVVGGWIDDQIPGGYIYGASRLGKTRCIQFHLRQALEDRLDAPLPLIKWNRVAESQSGEAGFWQKILIASKFEFADQSKILRKQTAARLCRDRFVAIARNAGVSFVVLLIDEAQDITLREWKWLVGLQNELDYDGILLTVFSVGSHQLGLAPDYMGNTGNAHVAARFMTARAEFHGLRSIQELQCVLTGYDQSSEWPEGSGTSYLEYFAPEDFGLGMRLVHHAQEFWDALMELNPNSRRIPLEVPMQHVARAIEASLLKLSCGAAWNDVTRYEHWVEELGKANYPEHMRLIAARW